MVGLAVKSDQMQREQFTKVLPKSLRNSLTDGLLDEINTLIASQDLRDSYKENLVGYTNVLMDGKYRLSAYLEAVQFVSYKLLGSSNADAYNKTFPDRVQRLVQNGADTQKISAYVAAYARNILVNKIMEQTMVPVHILNKDMYQDALNVQVGLMHTSKSDKVRSDAANSILQQLRPPEIKKIELGITHKEDSSIADLKATTMELVNQQREMIKAGAMDAKKIAHSTLIEDGEVVED